MYLKAFLGAVHRPISRFVGGVAQLGARQGADALFPFGTAGNRVYHGCRARLTARNAICQPPRKDANKYGSYSVHSRIPLKIC
jgi:hypothetical protein